MIIRLWHGWPAPQRAQEYERLLVSEIAPAILDRRIPGLRDVAVLRRAQNELDPAQGGEILTIMRFDDPEAVAAFTGGDPSVSVVPAAARHLLSRFDQHSQHYLPLADFPNQR